MDEVLGDFISDEDDSEDVYIESELDNESGNNGLLFNSVFFVINGKCYENEMLLKLMEKLFSYQIVQNKMVFKVGLLGYNGVLVGKMFRLDLISDVSDVEMGK